MAKRNQLLKAPISVWVGAVRCESAWEERTRDKHEGTRGEGREDPAWLPGAEFHLLVWY